MHSPQYRHIPLKRPSFKTHEKKKKVLSSEQQEADGVFGLFFPPSAFLK